MVIGIDATSIRGGGGSTHLIELLSALEPSEMDIHKIIVWAGTDTSSSLPERPWLIKVTPKMLDKGFFARTIWQIIFLSKSAASYNCNIIYIPGGSYFGSFKPVVSMSQNLLPFEPSEYKRFGISKTTLRFLLLRYSQSKTFQKSAGVIFLTQYAKSAVEAITGKLHTTKLIPHGISSKFFKEPKSQFSYDQRSDFQPIKVLYVSIINQYKHQWNVVAAIDVLRKKYNYPIELILVGPSFPSSQKRLDLQVDCSDPDREWVKYTGPVSHNELISYYSDADLGVFASSCENLPIILLEKMASGLPIASSNRGPMPDVLEDSGVYFNPESQKEIESSIFELINSPDLRSTLSNKSFERAKLYNWKNCSFETFKFLSDVAKRNNTVSLKK